MIIDTLKELLLYKPYCAYRRLRETKEEYRLIHATAASIQSQVLENLFGRSFRVGLNAIYPADTFHQALLHAVEKDAIRAIRFFYYLSRFVSVKDMPFRLLGPYCIWIAGGFDPGMGELWFSGILAWKGFTKDRNGMILALAQGYGRDASESFEKASNEYIKLYLDQRAQEN
jgi:hypothetical protein